MNKLSSSSNDDPQANAARIADLQATARGQVLLPGDAGYDEARKIWNAMVDRRPAVIVRCAGVADVGKGVIAATSQQYPLRMAAMGVAAGVEYAKTGKKVSGYTDTGVTLIAAKPQAGVDSKDVKTGTDLCWGAK